MLSRVSFQGAVADAIHSKFPVCGLCWNFCLDNLNGNFPRFNNFNAGVTELVLYIYFAWEITEMRLLWCKIATGTCYDIKTQRRSQIRLDYSEPSWLFIAQNMAQKTPQSIFATLAYLLKTPKEVPNLPTRNKSCLSWKHGWQIWL